MNYYVMTLFPEMIQQGMNTSIIGRAMAKGLLSLEHGFGSCSVFCAVRERCLSDGVPVFIVWGG